MFKQINSQLPLTDVVTLAEAKTQCRVTHTMEDTYISSLIPVAAEMAQSYTGRLLSVGSVTVVVDSYASEVQLPFGNATTVTELLLDGTASTDFTFDTVTQKLTVSSPYSTAKVTYNCGYTVVPSAVKQGVLMMISTLYNGREDGITGVTVADMPLTSRMLLDTVKIYGI